MNGGLQKSNLFATAKSSISTSAENTSGFVFGQNVHERVTGVSVYKQIVVLILNKMH